MGLDTSHDCWHGPYSSFMAWRTELARAAGLPPLLSMQGFGGDTEWSSLPHSPLHLLLYNSDCDEELRWQDCDSIAEKLEELIPLMPEGWRGETGQFAKGLRLAAKRKEDVEFH